MADKITESETTNDYTDDPSLNRNDDENDDEQDQVKTWTNIVAELCSKAPDHNIRDCLRLYDPSKPTRNIRGILKRCKNDVLIKTLSYLGKENLEHTKKELLLDILILRIKNFFPDMCQICNEAFCFKLNDEPFLACEGCGQEVHRPCFVKKLTELQMLNEDGSVNKIINSIPGMHYLCGGCENDTITNSHEKENHSISISKPNTQTQSIKKNISETSITLIEPDPIIINRYTSMTNLVKNDSDLTITNEYVEPRNHLNLDPIVIIQNNDPPRQEIPADYQDESTNYEGNKESTIRLDYINKRRIAQNQQNLPLNSDSSFPDKQIPPMKNTKRCRFYINGNCRLTRNECPFLHPKPCSKLMMYGTHKERGCNLGKTCDYLHPKMCPLSISKQECFNKECQLKHIKGTKRETPQKLNK